MFVKRKNGKKHHVMKSPGETVKEGNDEKVGGCVGAECRLRRPAWETRKQGSGVGVRLVKSGVAGGRREWGGQGT